MRDVDGRTREARRRRTIYMELADRLGHAPDVVERALLLDCVELILRAERPSDSETRLSISYALRHALHALGLQPQRPQSEPDPRADALARVRAFREEHGG